jgi:hypothetical protein
VRLNLEPWDGYYIVFHPLVGSPQDAILEATNADRLDSVARHDRTFEVHVSGPVTAPATFVRLRSGNHVYQGAASSNGALPFTLSGKWQFRPEPDRVSVPYARVSNAMEGAGSQLGWDTPGFDDTDWPQMWLNEEQSTIRHWQVIGPFPNPDNDGFGEVYPPQLEFDLRKKYDGLNGQVGWEDLNSNEPQLSSSGGWGAFTKTTEGGAFSDTGYIVNFNPQLLTNDDSWIVSYAHTYLYSPTEQHAEFLVAADNWSVVWLNHKRVFAQLRTPFWYELNDNWADRIPVDLHKGWNEVLVKVGKARGAASGFYGFTFRVTDDKGDTLSDIVADTSPEEANEPNTSNTEMRWYRVQVPPGCVAVVPPKFHASYRLILNEREITQPGNTPVDIRRYLKDDKNTLVIIARKDDPLVSPVQFVTGATAFALKPWTQTGLANFSGTADYTKTFILPEAFRDKRVMLDLGRVSSVADVFVNGEHAGALVWRPYQLDITKLVKPGANEIKIVVTNTEANRRAVGTSHHILSAIEICGLEGPVQIIPSIDQTITLRASEYNNAQAAHRR